MVQMTSRPSTAGAAVPSAELPYAEGIVPTRKAPRRVVVLMAVAQFGVFVGLLAGAFLLNVGSDGTNYTLLFAAAGALGLLGAAAIIPIKKVR